MAEPIEGQDEILRNGTEAGSEPLLDTLASLARTALSDPAALDLRETRDGVEEANVYAIDRLDDIIDALNPSEETLATFAATFRILGRHLAERRDYLAATDYEPEMLVRCHEAAEYIDAALDSLDQAIRTLEDEDA